MANKQKMERNIKKGIFSLAMLKNRLFAMKFATILAIALLFLAAVNAATVSHTAEQIRAGSFGNVFVGNFSFVNGSVGIGTTEPGGNLDILSETGSATLRIRAGNNAFFILSNENISKNALFMLVPQF